MQASARSSGGIKTADKAGEIFRTGNPLGFHAPEIDDIRWAKPILLAAGRMGCEFSFGNIYAWSPVYQTCIAHYDGFFLAASRCDRPESTVYCLPQGPGRLRDGIALIRADAARRGIPLRVFGVTREDAIRLEEEFPGMFRLEWNRDDADYIYRRADLASLAGKRYHQKRNHISRFERENRWSYEELRPDTLEECADVTRRWTLESADKPGFEKEALALNRCFAQYERLGCVGGLLRVEGEAAAFSIGERLNPRTFCTHYEKALPDIPGAYQKINREFAANSLEGYEYVNREEDVGSEGLRRAKLSYHPEILLEKAVATEMM
ncbi:MAG: phosphatidylglycerol lysyltransferase domain-containing protein [Oscillospiraceae bacterium]|nr:phosphatidylglycerol lysyltransferase domain-containing protein [Oscillospiraceae bacterium]